MQQLQPNQILWELSQTAFQKVLFPPGIVDLGCAPTWDSMMNRKPMPFKGVFLLCSFFDLRLHHKDLVQLCMVLFLWIWSRRQFSNRIDLMGCVVSNFNVIGLLCTCMFSTGYVVMKDSCTMLVNWPRTIFEQQENPLGLIPEHDAQFGLSLRPEKTYAWAEIGYTPTTKIQNFAWKTAKNFRDFSHTYSTETSILIEQSF